jgi:Nif-specific regulatory protein
MRTSEVEPRASFSVSSPSSARLASLIEISRLLTSAVDLDHLLSLILKTSSQLVGSEDSSLLLLDPATQELVFVMAQGSVGDKLKMVRLKPGEGIAGWVVQHGKPVLANDVERDPRFTSKVDKLTGFRTKAILAVPLQDHGRTIGVIEVLNPDKDRKFNEEDRELLAAYASHAAVAIRNARLVSSIKEANRYLQAEIDERYGTLIGKSAGIRAAVKSARKVAETSATVLLLGETGVGKEMFARSIHSWSPRAAKPFVAVNCVALAEGLLETELFGHEKGAFTGAHQQKKGLLELAQGGTVFLDEIGDTKPEFQAKLLRVLQTHQFERVGGTAPITVDIRFIAASNKDLEGAVQAGSFRKDLFFRLNVVTITVPPLRERKEDIPALANFFLGRYCRDMKRSPMTIRPSAMKLLTEHNWPGNVRELENVIERAVVLTAGNEISPHDLAIGSRDMPTGDLASLLELPFHVSVQAHKKALISHAINKAKGNKTQAATLLQLQSTYLFRLCKQLGIT